jgi:hypothetical protein
MSQHAAHTVLQQQLAQASSYLAWPAAQVSGTHTGATSFPCNSLQTPTPQLCPRTHVSMSARKIRT